MIWRIDRIGVNEYYIYWSYSFYHNNCFSLLLWLEFVFWIWIGKQIQIITFNLSYINTNDSDCVFCGHIWVIFYSISLQYKCIWHLKNCFSREIWELYFFQFCFIWYESDSIINFFKTCCLFFTNRWGTNHVQWFLIEDKCSFIIWVKYPTTNNTDSMINISQWIHQLN